MWKILNRCYIAGLPDMQDEEFKELNAPVATYSTFYDILSENDHDPFSVLRATLEDISRNDLWILN